MELGFKPVSFSIPLASKEIAMPSERKILRVVYVEPLIVNFYKFGSGWKN
jgi:hypothetical protein